MVWYLIIKAVYGQCDLPWDSDSVVFFEVQIQECIISSGLTKPYINSDRKL